MLCFLFLFCCVLFCYVIKLSYVVMLCCVMLLSYFMLCYVVILCCVTLRNVILFYVILQRYVVTLYYNLTGPPSYMRSVVDRNVVMRRMTVFVLCHIFKVFAANRYGVILPLTMPTAQVRDPQSAKPNVCLLSLHKKFSPYSMVACISCNFHHSQYAYAPTPVTYTIPVTNRQKDSVCSFCVDRATGRQGAKLHPVLILTFRILMSTIVDVPHR